MMKTRRFVGMMLSLMMVACQQEYVPEQETAGGNEDIRLRAAISGSNVSRTTVQENGETVFAPDDEVGFFMPDAETPVQFIYDAEKWSAEAEQVWPDLTTPFTFCAFYPYQEDAVRERIPMPDLSLQTGELAEIGTFDFLAATKTCGFADANGEVSFTGADAFKHVYSLLMVTLSTEDEVATLLKSAQLTGAGCFTAHDYRFTESGVGEMIQTLDAGAVDSWELQVAEEGEEIPQETGRQIVLLLNPSDAEVTLDFSIGYEREGVSFTASTQAISQAFTGGYCYQYRIRINDGMLIVGEPEISAWQSGEVTEGGDLVVEGTPQ